MAVYRERISTIAVKPEATEGTAETSALVSTFRVQNLQVTTDLRLYERPIVSEFMGAFRQVPGAKSIRVSFDIAPSGAASLANLGSNGAEYDALMKPCMWKSTLVASTSATYDPETTADSNVATITLRGHVDGLFYAARGCRGTWTARCARAGDPIVYSFEFLGVYDHEQGETAVPTTTLLTVLPQAWAGSTVSINAVTSLKVKSFEVAAGNQLELRESLGATDGYLSTVVVGVAPSFTMMVEPEAVGTHDFLSLAEDATEMALSLTSGATAANIQTITAPKLTYNSIQPRFNAGLLCYEVTGQFNRSSGDDHLRVAWT
jgi:hypothetical protein